jgi:hypothetical protein
LRSAASSDANDNFAVAMAPPAKRAKTIRGSATCKRKATTPIALHVPHKDKNKNKQRVIKSSNESNEDGTDDGEAFLASCNKALGKRDPLDIE